MNPATSLLQRAVHFRFESMLSMPMHSVQPRPFAHAMHSLAPATPLRLRLPGRPAGLLALLALLALGHSPAARAQANGNPPTKLTYQGFLTDQNGKPLGDPAPVNKNIVFRIYDVASNGSSLWSSSQTVTIDKGHFSVLLGEGSAVATEPFSADLSSVFAGSTASDRFLELSVDSTKISPRLQFFTSPYAFLARRANEVDGAALTSGTIPAARLTGVDGTGLNALNANSLTLGTVPDGRLSQNVAKLNTAQTFTAVNTFAEKVEIRGAKVLQFGSDLTREPSAGSIGYGTQSGNALDIVGAGTSANSRKIKAYAEGGFEVTGPVTATAFNGNGAVPVGGIIMWSGSADSVPGGWALCNGVATLNGKKVPNLTDRFVLAAGGSYAVGAIGGAKEVSLTIANLPPHTHDYVDNYFQEVRNTWKGGGDPSANDGTGKNVSTTRPTASVGSGTPVNNMPPYYALAFIIRIQ